MKFTTRLSLVQRLRINGDIPLLLLYTFVVWTTKTIPLPLLKNLIVESGVFNLFWQRAKAIVWYWLVGHMCENYKKVYTYCINYCVCVCVCL